MDTCQSLFYCHRHKFLIRKGGIIVKTFNELQSLFFYKERMLLPHDKADPHKGYLFYILNTSLDSLNVLLANDHKYLSNTGNLYNNYYYDHTVLPKSINSKRIINSGLTVATAKKDRIVKYAEVKEKCGDTIRLTPISLTALSGKNFVYDLTPFIDLYTKQKKLQQAFMVEKLTTYFTSLSDLYKKEIPGYTRSCIVVNLDEYDKTVDKTIHILWNILLLLRRSEKVIQSLDGICDFKILFYTTNGYFLFDMAKDVKKSNLAILTRLLHRLIPVSSLDNDLETEESNEVKKRVAMSVSRKNMTGDESDVVTSEEDIPDEVADTVKNNVNNVDELDNDSVMSEIDDTIFKDEATKKLYLDTMTKKVTGQKSAASIKRDEMLREKQKDIKIRNKTIEEITKEKTIPQISEDYIDTDVVTNENIKHVKFANFNKDYMENLYQKDVTNMITCLNDKTIPVTVLDVKVEDTSDTLTLKETYTVTFEDDRRMRHTLKFALPKFIDDKFMYINGNKKSIQTQIFAYPVVKTGPDEVQICTNYNKIFIRRYGNKFNKNIEKLKKLMEDDKTISFTYGCNSSANENHLTSLEYDILADQYNEIIIGKGHFIFNANRLDELMKGVESSSLDKTLVGYESPNMKPIYYEHKKDSVDDLVTLMMTYATDEQREKFGSYSSGKKFVHTKATIMAKNIPVVILISFFEGLDTVIRKFNDPTVVFSDKKNLGDNYNYIKFADGYLCYPMSNMEACLMFNGFTEFNTSAYTFAEMNQKETYLEIFDIVAGSSYIAGALVNYYDFMIDPITLEILQTLDYPTDIVSLIIFANNMLADNQYVTDIDLHNYRLRSNEVVSAILYKNIARAYARYRSTANNPNPVKMTMDENAVIKELMALPTVEDYSTLTPMVELHKASLASMKGANGMNLDRAYKEDKRAYHDSMIGVFAISTDIAANCGKIRQLVVEPTVINARGFMDLNNREHPEKLKDVNLANAVEMMTVMSHTHDAPQRIAMSTKQTTHVIPVSHNSPALISNGMDVMAHYRTGNDFSVVATQNGKVVELDERTNIMIVEYKDGTKQGIDLSPHVVKNGGGGFYLANKLKPNFKKGQTFKTNDILAYDPKYYKDNGVLGNRLTMGSLMKVAVMSNYSTYEDSAFITKYMSEQMASELTMRKVVIVGHNATVEHIVKPGDNVTIGDDLIRYETSYDDSELNRLLSNVRDDMKEQIINLGKSNVTSSYTGVISDVVITSTVDLDELSPSLRKIVKSYQDNIKAKKGIVDKYAGDKSDNVYKLGVMIDKPYDKVSPDEYGKVKGEDVGKGVLIEFYITYHDELSDGDKLTSYTANKYTIGYQIPRGKEPYSEFRKYEEISAPVAPSAILQRGTPSVIITGCASKVLIELKRKMYEVLTGENFDEVLKQKQPYMIKHHEKAVNESIDELSTDRCITESEIVALETLFDLHYSVTGYTSDKAFMAGDIIMSLNPDMNMSMMLERFDISDIDEYANAIIDHDRGMIVATGTIMPGEPIVIKFD